MPGFANCAELNLPRIPNCAATPAARGDILFTAPHHAARTRSSCAAYVQFGIDKVGAAVNSRRPLGSLALGPLPANLRSIVLHPWTWLDYFHAILSTKCVSKWTLGLGTVRYFAAERLDGRQSPRLRLGGRNVCSSCQQWEDLFDLPCSQMFGARRAQRLD